MRRSKYTRPAWLKEQGEGGQGTADKPRLTTKVDGGPILNVRVQLLVDDRNH